MLLVLVRVAKDSTKIEYRNQSEKNVNKFIEFLNKTKWEMMDEFIILGGNLVVEQLFKVFLKYGRPMLVFGIFVLR